MTLKSGDFNGDGLVDIVAYGPTETANGDVEMVLDVAYSTGDGKFLTVTKALTDPALKEINLAHKQLRDDVLAGKGVEGQAFKIDASTALETILAAVPTITLLDGDFNGDGITDLVLVAATSTTTPLPVFLSHGAGKWSAHVIPTDNPALSTFAALVDTPSAHVTVIDVDGDKNDDIVVFHGPDSQKLCMSHGDGLWTMKDFSQVTTVATKQTIPGARMPSTAMRWSTQQWTIWLGVLCRTMSSANFWMTPRWQRHRKNPQQPQQPNLQVFLTNCLAERAKVKQRLKPLRKKP
jgi:hypothetical protein